MIDKDISSLSKSELIEKYKNMKEFIIKTSLAKNLSDEQIKQSANKEINNRPLEFVVDDDKSIIIRALEYEVYRNDKNQILMITTNKFEVIY